MIDITVQNIQTDLIQASLQQPVLLDIWAPWCGPCKQLGPVLERLEAQYGGRFLLAKLNSDEQPEVAGQLSQMFGVRSIPFCVMFVDGQPVDGFVGAQPEAQIRAFLDKHVPSEEELQAQAETDEAEMLAQEGHSDAALERLQQAVAIDPANALARFDYIKLLLQLGHLDEARAAYAPVAQDAMVDQRVAALGAWIEACEHSQGVDETALAAAIGANKRDFDARFALGQLRLAQQRHTDAMDELLEILMRDKAWGDGRARKLYVAVLELLTKPPAKTTAADTKGTLEVTGRTTVAGSDPVVDQYRRKLSMVLF